MGFCLRAATVVPPHSFPHPLQNLNPRGGGDHHGGGAPGGEHGDGGPDLHRIRDWLVMLLEI